MPNPLKKLESMYDIIFEAVTKKREAVQETAKKCKQLFKQKNSSADPEVLTQLEESLRARQDEQALAKRINQSEQRNSSKTPDELKELLKKQKEDYECYIQYFLPALLGEIILSRELKLEEIKKIAGIVSDAIKQGGEEEYKNFQRFLSKLETKIAESSKLKPEEKKERNAIIMKLKISDDLSKISDKDHSDNITQSQTDRRNSQISSIERSNDSESDSGRGSPRTNEESSRSPVSSRRSSLILVTSTSSEESLNSTLSSVEGDNGLQPEDEGETKLAHLTKTRSKGPSGRRSPSKHHEKKDPMQPEEKEEKAVSSKQEASKDILSKKQSNDRNLHVALAAGCALLAVGCLVAAAIAKLGILCVIGAVFAIEAITTWYLTPSSELTSTNLSRPVDDKSLQHVRSGKN